MHLMIFILIGKAMTLRTKEMSITGEKHKTKNWNK